jgi:O-acetylhomoserine (thiol)-lyase
MRARAEGLRDFGACMSPANAFYLLPGRRDPSRAHGAPCRQCRGGRPVSGEARRRRLGEVSGLESHPDFALAKRQLPKGAGAILSFGIKGGRKAGAKLIERLKVFSHLPTSATPRAW